MHYKFNPAQRVFNSTSNGFEWTGENDESALNKNNKGHRYLNTPKQKHIFFIRFELTPHALEYCKAQYGAIPGTNIYIDFDKLSYFVKSCDRPSTTYETEPVNQYNRTRHYYKKLIFNPVNMEIYDDKESEVLKVLWMYQRYYYGEFSEHATPSWWNYDTVTNSANYEQFSQGSWGYNFSNMGDKDETFFFRRISIVEINNYASTCHNIYNPKLTSINLGEKDQDDSSGEVISLTFEHEGITMLYPEYDHAELKEETVIGRWSDDHAIDQFSELLFGEDAPLNRHGYYLDEARFLGPDGLDESLLDAAKSGDLGAVAGVLFDEAAGLAGEGISAVGGALTDGTNYLIGAVSGSKDESPNGQS